MTPSRRYKGKIAKFQKKLDEMHVGAGNWQEVDAKGKVRFVQLPKETFRFVESVCYNAKFDKDNVYVPVQHNDLDCYVYKFSLTAGEGDITPELIGHVLLKNGEDDITPFGSALSPDGVMWSRALRRNQCNALHASARCRWSHWFICAQSACSM